MLFVLGLSILLIFAAAQLVLIWQRPTPRIQWTRRDGGPNRAWRSAIILLAIPLALWVTSMAPVFFLLGSSDDPGPQGIDFWFDVPSNSASLGFLLVLLLSLMIAQWRPSRAALVLVIAAGYIPIAFAIQANLLTDAVVSGNSGLQTWGAPIAFALFFSLPVLVVALLLWISAESAPSSGSPSPPERGAASARVSAPPTERLVAGANEPIDVEES